MEEILNNDTFLARWLSGDLTHEELDSFQKHPQFNQFKAILEETNDLKLASYEFKKTEILNKIKSKRINSSGGRKIIPIRRRTLIGIAAAILLLVSGYFILGPSSITLAAGQGEQFTHILPDGSTLVLNSNSSVTYDKRQFNNNRSLNLEGEAYFEVMKGGGFSIWTNNGSVNVLGTSFNVLNRGNTLQVSCKTGKVSVENNAGNDVILNPGERVRIEDGTFLPVEKIEAESVSFWQHGESRFEKVPLSDVIVALENHFKVKIEIDQSKAQDTFTGGFVHDDLDAALEMVFGAMEYEFEKKKGGIIVIK